VQTKTWVLKTKKTIASKPHGEEEGGLIEESGSCVACIHRVKGEKKEGPWGGHANGEKKITLEDREKGKGCRSMGV